MKTRPYKSIGPFLVLFMLLISSSNLMGFQGNGKLLNFQGSLYENGEAVNGERNFEFSIALDQGTWSETHNSVLVVDGLYAVVLGQKSDLPENLFYTTNERLITIKVGNNVLGTTSIFAPFGLFDQNKYLLKSDTSKFLSIADTILFVRQTEANQFMPQIDSALFIRETEKGQFMSQADSVLLEVETEKNQFMSQADSILFIRQVEADQFMPQADSADFIRETEKGQFMSQADSALFIRETEKNQFMPQTDSALFIRETEKGQFMSQADSALFLRVEEKFNGGELSFDGSKNLNLINDNTKIGGIEVFGVNGENLGSLKGGLDANGKEISYLVLSKDDGGGNRLTDTLFYDDLVDLISGEFILEAVNEGDSVVINTEIYGSGGASTNYGFQALAKTDSSNVGVFGEAIGSASNTKGQVGVSALAKSSNSISLPIGLLSNAKSTTGGVAYGAFSTAEGGDVNVGLYGSTAKEAGKTNWAGWFDGSVNLKDGSLWTTDSTNLFGSEINSFALMHKGDDTEVNAILGYNFLTNKRNHGGLFLFADTLERSARSGADIRRVSLTVDTTQGGSSAGKLKMTSFHQVNEFEAGVYSPDGELHSGALTLRSSEGHDLATLDRDDDGSYPGAGRLRLFDPQGNLNMRVGSNGTSAGSLELYDSLGSLSTVMAGFANGGSALYFYDSLGNTNMRFSGNRGGGSYFEMQGRVNDTLNTVVYQHSATSTNPWSNMVGRNTDGTVKGRVLTGYPPGYNDPGILVTGANYSQQRIRLIGGETPYLRMSGVDSVDNGSGSYYIPDILSINTFINGNGNNYGFVGVQNSRNNSSTNITFNEGNGGELYPYMYMNGTASENVRLGGTWNPDLPELALTGIDSVQSGSNWYIPTSAHLQVSQTSGKDYGNFWLYNSESDADYRLTFQRYDTGLGLQPEFEIRSGNGAGFGNIRMTYFDNSGNDEASPIFEMMGPNSRSFIVSANDRPQLSLAGLDSIDGGGFQYIPDIGHFLVGSDGSGQDYSSLVLQSTSVTNDNVNENIRMGGSGSNANLPYLSMHGEILDSGTLRELVSLSTSQNSGKDYSYLNLGNTDGNKISMLSNYESFLPGLYMIGNQSGVRLIDLAGNADVGNSIDNSRFKLGATNFDSYSNPLFLAQTESDANGQWSTLLMSGNSSMNVEIGAQPADSNGDDYGKINVFGSKNHALVSATTFASGGTDMGEVRVSDTLNNYSYQRHNEMYLELNGKFNTTIQPDRFQIYNLTNNEVVAAIDSLGNAFFNGSVFTDINAGASDRRLKKNINSLVGALNKVEQLRGVSYNWKDENKPENRVGFIAQEVEKIIPEVVFTRPDGMKAIGYGDITALLAEAVKELSAKVKALEKENQSLKLKAEETSELKSQVLSLEERLAQIEALINQKSTGNN